MDEELVFDNQEADFGKYVQSVGKTLFNVNHLQVGY